MDFHKISKRILKEQTLYFEETSSITTSFFITQITPLLSKKGANLLVLPTQKEVSQWTSALKTWTQHTKTPLINEAIDIQPSEKQQRTLQQSPFASNMLFVMSSQTIHEKIFTTLDAPTFSVGDRQSPATLRETLQKIGYQEEQRSYEPATFSVTGDAITITTPMLEQIRINLLGSKIETMLYKNNATTTIEIPPNALSKHKALVESLIQDSITTLFSFEETVPEKINAKHRIIFTLHEKDALRISNEDKQQITQLYKNISKPTREQKKVRPPQIDYAFLDSLNEEDHIVHRDHGIGKYKGRILDTIKNIKKEFFIIEYAHADKLYVPVTYAGKLSKYIGSANPTIHRIGGSLWNHARRKVQKDTENIAKELAKLYAKREQAKGFSYRPDTEETILFESAFPYTPTIDQHQAIDDVKEDMQTDQPMDRLICGDVGFGKTEVAMRAAHKAVMDHKQVAILAPTTILVQQHFDSFKKRFKDTNIRIAQLSRFESPSSQQRTIDLLCEGEIQIVIGTHRLLSKDVHFQNLGLLIIDEEQRFGVKQKEHFKKLRSTIDILTLSATPIPRTLNMSLSGLRNISVIRTPPQKRKAIISHIGPYDTALMKEALTREYQRDGQTYYLYNKVITIGEKQKELEKLLKKWKLPLRIRVAHGQLPEQQLAHVIKEFDEGIIDILLCSTIIQNGIDLPNVNTIIIDNAPEFGLPQLYQLKGRVGRGAKQGYAYMFYHSKKLSGLARERLQALKDAEHLGAGFEIAMRDMEIRGTGNLLGKEQSGNISAVGIGLYTYMLEEAIQQLEHGEEEKPALTDPTVDLPLPTFIPSSLTDNPQEQLHIYETITLARNSQDLQHRTIKLQEQYGTLPQEVQNIILITQITLLASENRILNITTESSKSENKPTEILVITFADPLTPQIIQKLLTVNNNWKINNKEKTVQIDLSNLGNTWPQKILHILQ